MLMGVAVCVRGGGGGRGGFQVTCAGVGPRGMQDAVACVIITADAVGCGGVTELLGSSNHLCVCAGAKPFPVCSGGSSKGADILRVNIHTLRHMPCNEAGLLVHGLTEAAEGTEAGRDVLRDTDVRCRRCEVDSVNGLSSLWCLPQ